MKKLLSILAAVGLTATTGVSVVACGGDKKSEVKPQIADLLKEKLELGKVKTKTEALAKAHTEIDQVKRLKDHVKLDDTVPGQIKVTASDETLSGEATFTYQLEWTMIRTNISDIKISNIYVGMSIDEYQPIIQEAINQLVLGTQITQDYTIKGSTSQGGKNKITVAATADSELITGQFQIDILMLEIDGAQINISDHGMMERTIENWDQLEEVNVKLKMDDEKANSFSHAELIDKQVRFTIDQTTKINGVFTGSITVTASHVEPVKIAVQVIKADPKDIADLLAKKLELGYFLTKNDAKKQADKIVKEMPELVGKVIVDEPSNNSILVRANDPTLTGSAEFKYQLKKDINLLITNKDKLGAVTDEKKVIGVVLAANLESGLTDKDIAVESFIGSTPGVTGKATIKAISVAYTGTAKVIFNALTQISLVDKLPKFENLPATTDKDKVIEIILNANQESGLTANDLEVDEKSFIASALGVTGYAEINSKNVAYTGTVKATFNAQIPLKTKLPNFENLPAAIDTDKAIEIILNANLGSGLTDKDIEVEKDSFIASARGVAGYAKIKSKNMAYTGEVEATFVMLQKTEIEIDISGVNVITGQEPVKLSIKNFAQLINPRAESNDSKIATAQIVGGNLEITGVDHKKNSVVVLVKADNANTAIIPVNVYNQEEKIETVDSANVLVEGEHLVKISNYEKLIGIKAEVNNPEKVSCEVVEGGIKLTGKEKDVEGNLSLTISAANATQAVQVQLTVNLQESKIEVDNSEIELSFANKEPIKVEVTNLQGLENVKIKSLDNDIIEIIDSSPDPITKIFKIKLGKNAKPEITTALRITSDYTPELIVSVTIF